MPDPIDPTLAVALAAAAGLDTSDLKAQIKRQQAGDDDPDQLRARIAELEGQLGEPPEDPAGDARQAEADAIGAALKASGVGRGWRSAGEL